MTKFLIFLISFLIVPLTFLSTTQEVKAQLCVDEGGTCWDNGHLCSGGTSSPLECGPNKFCYFGGTCIAQCGVNVGDTCTSQLTCESNDGTVVTTPNNCTNPSICCDFPEPTPAGGPEISADPDLLSCSTFTTTLSASGLPGNNGNDYYVYIECAESDGDCTGTDFIEVGQFSTSLPTWNGTASFTIDIGATECGSGSLDAGKGTYDLLLTNYPVGHDDYKVLATGILILSDTTSPPGNTPPPTTPITPIATIGATCAVNGQTGINTAIGCIPVYNQNELSAFFLRWGISIGGGIALLIAITGGIIIKTSAGDPAKKQLGSQLTTAAFTGLLLLLFSAYILELLGVQILNLPGF